MLRQIQTASIIEEQLAAFDEMNLLACYLRQNDRHANSLITPAANEAQHHQSQCARYCKLQHCTCINGDVI